MVNVVRIARALRTSTASVSRALNDKPGVGPALRKRILEYSVRNGYVASDAARTLKSKRTRLIGLIVPTLSNAAYAIMTENLQRGLEENRYTLVSTTSDFDLGKEATQARVLLERGIEALVVVGNEHSAELEHLVSRHGIPTLATYTFNPGGRFPTVGCNNFAAMANAVQFLLDCGHRRFAYLSGVSRHNDRVKDRTRGIRSRLIRAGIRLDPDLIVESRYTLEGGYESMSRLIPRRNEFTAAICGSDILALGAISACRDHGIAVPEDVSVLGHDNQEFAAHVSPPLTTVEARADLMGKAAARSIVDTLDGGQVLGSTELESRIVVRRSVRDLRADGMPEAAAAVPRR
jgi:LacI family transcriptional regulator